MSFAAYLAEDRGEGAFWRRSVLGWAFLPTAVQLDQVTALRVTGEFTVCSERTMRGRVRIQAGSCPLPPRETAPETVFSSRKEERAGEKWRVGEQLGATRDGESELVFYTLADCFHLHYLV